MKITQSNFRLIKIKKQLGTTYYFGCKDYTKKFQARKSKNHI